MKKDTHEKFPIFKPKNVEHFFAKNVRIFYIFTALEVAVLSLFFKQRSLWLFSVPRSYENFQHFGTNSFTLEKMWIFFNWFSFGMILVVLPFCGAATFGQMDRPQIAAQVYGESLSGSTARQCCLLYLAIPSVTFYTLRMTNIWYLAHTMKYFCLRPSAKDQGITWVVVVVVLVHHLFHFLIKRNLRLKNSPQPGFELGTSGSTVLHSTIWAKDILLLFNLKIIHLFQKSSGRPWTSIGRHLFIWDRCCQ